jgi:hypothetical protein
MTPNGDFLGSGLTGIGTDTAPNPCGTNITRDTKMMGRSPPAGGLSLKWEVPIE